MMNRNNNIFSTLSCVAASFVLALAISGCSRQMAINRSDNGVRYVQTQDIHENHMAAKATETDISVAAVKPEGQPVAAIQPVTKTESTGKHGFAQKQNTKTIQRETAKGATATTYAATRRHHTTVRNADINRGGLISGIILLILGSILYVLPGPVGYILGTIVVVIAVILIVTAIL